MTRPAGAGPEEIVVAPSDGCLAAAARGRRPEGGWDIDDLVLRSAWGRARPCSRDTGLTGSSAHGPSPPRTIPSTSA